MRERLEEAAAGQASKTNKTSSMTGKIEEIPLPDLLQLFHTSKKNGVLVVTGAAARVASTCARAASTTR